MHDESSPTISNPRSSCMCQITFELYHISFPQANYGKSDKGSVEKVKAVYESLNLRQLYAEYEEQTYQNIGKLINEHSNVLPAPVFLELRDRIYKREK